jgi:uncharacterized membrane protein
VSTYEWLLYLHVTGAFLLLGGAVIAGVLNVAVQRRERPSEVALLLGLTRTAVALVGIGALLTLVLGLSLVHQAGYGFGQGWIVASILLWIGSNAAGGIGGNRDKQTRLLAERLEAEGDEPSPELSARLHDPVSVLLSYGSGLMVLAILALMIWKPGAP